MMLDTGRAKVGYFYGSPCIKVIDYFIEALCTQFPIFITEGLYVYGFFFSILQIQLYTYTMCWVEIQFLLLEEKKKRIFVIFKFCKIDNDMKTIFQEYKFYRRIRYRNQTDEGQEQGPA